jgi:hypothetical protein
MASEILLPLTMRPALFAVDNDHAWWDEDSQQKVAAVHVAQWPQQVYPPYYANEEAQQ